MDERTGKQPAEVGMRGTEELFGLVYDELRALAGAYLRGERAGHTLQATALANEVFLKISCSNRRIFEGKPQFMMAAAQAMRRILTDHARARRAEKRGGGAAREPLEEVRLGAMDSAVPLVEFDDALGVLSRLKPRVGQVVELRLFGGLTLDEVAECLGIAVSTVSEDWATGRAWLRLQLEGA